MSCIQFFDKTEDLHRTLPTVQKLAIVEGRAALIFETVLFKICNKQNLPR